MFDVLSSSVPGGSRSRSRALGATALVSVSLVLSGCASGVTVSPAPHATDPVCASIVLALPDSLGNFPRIKTASQATAAWGDTPQQAITLRCGADLLGPTEDPCTTVTDSSGREVDWVTVQDPETEDWTMTTYGRSPAVEVTIPSGMSSSPIVELTGAISLTSADRFCA